MSQSINDNQSVDILIASAKTINSYAYSGLDITPNDAKKPLYDPPLYEK